MSLWKSALIVAVIASGFWIGFLWKSVHKPLAPEMTAAPAPQATVTHEQTPPEFDPSLVLPPPDQKGVLLDPTFLIVQDHFKDVGQLKDPAKIAIPDLGVQPVGALTPKKDVPTQPGRLVAIWDKKVTYKPDPSRGEKLYPGLVLKIFLFKPDLTATYIGDGKLIIDLYDSTPRGPNSEPKQTDMLIFEPEVLKLYADPDKRFGDCYKIFLPWTKYGPEITHAFVNMRYTSASGEKLIGQSGTFQIDHSETTKHARPDITLPPQATPPAPEPPPAPLPPTFRMPAPSDEPAPRVDQIHRPPGLWLYTNKRDIKLNFDVMRSGPSGIRAVELWARHRATGAVSGKPPVQQAKGGEPDEQRLPQNYVCVDRLEGDRPPFATRLWSEGTYQFRAVFESGTGVKSPAPTCDEQPDLYVCLDTTKPQVEMLPPVSESPGVVKLRWQATDANLEEASIRLEFSIDGESWRPVQTDAAWLPNAGQYDWKIPKGLPPELHLRVLARDKAGNVGESRSQSKYPIDLTVPEGRISGFVECLPEPRAILDCSNHSLGKPIRTIYLPVFKNKALQTSSMYRDLELGLTHKVIVEIEMMTPWKITSDPARADAELIGTVVSLDKNSLNRDQKNEIREGPIVVGVEFVWRDLRTRKVLTNPGGLPFPILVTYSGRYLPDVGESSVSAQHRVCKQLAKKIIATMESAIGNGQAKSTAVRDASTFPEGWESLPMPKELPSLMKRIADPELLPIPRVLRVCAEEKERSTGVIEGAEEEP